MQLKEFQFAWSARNEFKEVAVGPVVPKEVHIARNNCERPEKGEVYVSLK